MGVHPQVQVLLDRMATLNLTPVVDLTPEAARRQMDAMARARDADPPRVGHVDLRRIPGPAGEIAVRIYRPLGSDDDAILPIVVFYHGGGHVIGSLDSHDANARRLCNGAGATVVSVDYRMGPEHPFPAAVEDCFAALQWVGAHAASFNGDGSRIAVSGDSAGANLATVSAILARDAGGPALRHQILVYPVADYSCSSPSYTKYARGYGILEADTMLWFRRHYLGDEARAVDWRASPLKCPDLKGLPPAFVLTAECDVLHDEGVAYAEALKAAGVTVRHKDYAGMIHGFISFAPGVDGAVEAHRDAAAELRAAFA